MDYFIEQFKERVYEQAILIDNSGLKNVNEELYQELREKIRKLNLKLIAYQENEGTVVREELSHDQAEIGALFDFYMQTGGSQKIASFHIEKIKSNLREIINKVNQHNYEKVNAEFQEAMAQYERILTAAANSFLVREVVDSFQYQIFKFQMNDGIYDDTIDAKAFISLVIRDINTLFQDESVSSDLKFELKKYSVDTTMVADNLLKVMILINLGFSNKTVSKDQILEEYQKAYYKKSDLEKRYDGHKIMPTERTERNKPDRLYKNGKIILKNVDSYTPEELALIIINANMMWHYFGEIESVLIEEIKSYLANDLQYLIEILLMRVNCEAFLVLRKSFNEDYIFDCAVYAHKDDGCLSPNFIVEYIVGTDSSLLINYIVKSGEVAYFTENLKSYAVEKQNTTLLKGFVEHDLIDDVTYKSLNSELQIMVIKKRLEESESKESKLEILKDFYQMNDGENVEVSKFIVAVLLSFNNKDYIISFLTYVLDYLSNFEKGFFFVIEEISDEILRREVLDYFYPKVTNVNSSESKLICDRVKNFKTQNIALYNNDIDNLNIFEAGYVSNFIWSSIPYFVEKYGNNPYLDWEHIILKSHITAENPDFNVIKCCYLVKREYFMENIRSKCSSTFAIRMIREVPSSIVDFLGILSDEEVLALPSASLEYLCGYYEEEMKKSGLDTNAFINKCLSGKCLNIRGCLVFIMYRGLLNDEIMKSLNYSMLSPVFNRPNTSEPGSSFLLLVEAVKRSKYGYLRPAMVSLALNGTVCEKLPYNIMFMSTEEIEELKNSEETSLEIRSLKLRKYYGDLLQLLKVVPWVKIPSVIKEIVKSNVEEYIMFVSSNYPHYRELILENISDPEIYKKVIGFDGTVSVDDALRIHLLEEGGARK